MIKITIINDFYNYKYEYLPLKFKNLIKYYKNKKLRYFINYLKKKYNDNAKITIINQKENSLDFNKNIAQISISDIRFNLDKNIYTNIRDKIVNTTRSILANLIRNIGKFKIFYLEYPTLFVPKLIEFNLAQYFNLFFGHFELIKYYVENKDTDIVIFYNCNLYSLDFFKKIKTKKSLFYNDNVLLKIQNVLKTLNFFHFLIFILFSYFKNKFIKPNYKVNKNLHFNERKKTILFAIKTKNQFNSVKPISDQLIKDKLFHPRYYFFEYFLNLKQLFKLIYYLQKNRNLLLRNCFKISKGLIYDSISLKGILKILYNSYFLIKFSEAFMYKENLVKFIDNDYPNLLVIANDFKDAERIAAAYFDYRKIPTLFIPHSAIPIIDELTTKLDIKYFALGGERDKLYYISRGIPGKNIKIVGIPRYEPIYKNKIKKLDKVLDMFDKRVYDLSKVNFTVLLTTNPIDDKTNEKLITAVIKSLKELNMINNLIIKLHPHEDGLLHKSISINLNVNPIILKNYNILEMINSCDLLISRKSTTILEAMIIGKPIILIDFVNQSFKETSRYEFLDKSFIPNIKEPDTLTQQIEEIILELKNKNNYNQKLKDFSSHFSFYDYQTTPTQKIINYITEILRNNFSSDL